MFSFSCLQFYIKHKFPSMSMHYYLNQEKLYYSRDIISQIQTLCEVIYVRNETNIQEAFIWKGSLCCVFHSFYFIQASPLFYQDHRCYLRSTLQNFNDSPCKILKIRVEDCLLRAKIDIINSERKYEKFPGSDRLASGPTRLGILSQLKE